MKDYTIEKILVIQTAFIGDAILTLPMIQVLKKIFPESEVHVLCIPSTEEIFKASPYVNEVKVLDKKNKHKSIFSLFRFSRNLKKEKYSRLYSPHRSFRTALLVMLLGIRETSGFSNSSLMHVYKNLIEYKTEHHEVQRNLDLIGYNYSDNGWRILPEINISSETKNKIKDYLRLKNINDKYICIAPGSVWNTKVYPIEYYEEVIKFVAAKTNYKILLIGGEKDEPLSSDIASEFPDKVFSAAGIFTIVESIEILKRAELLITNDSAPTHMAMCADIPAITIYCSTTAGFGFYPYNKGSSYFKF